VREKLELVEFEVDYVKSRQKDKIKGIEELIELNN